VPQTLSGPVNATTLEGTTQILARGPVASQEAIKLMSGDGGGVFNANSAHPFENSTALTNLFEMLLMFLIGAALTNTFGRMVGNERQGWTDEVIIGAPGSGLYGMLLRAVVAVFVAGLMVGRTPEYLGKKIQSAEVKMAILALLVLSATILFLTSVAVVLPAGLAGLSNNGPHGFSELLYAYTSTPPPTAAPSQG
jgi:K+-transporting ATPase A subunit